MVHDVGIMLALEWGNTRVVEDERSGNVLEEEAERMEPFGFHVGMGSDGIV